MNISIALASCSVNLAQSPTSTMVLTKICTERSWPLRYQHSYHIAAYTLSSYIFKSQPSETLITRLFSADCQFWLAWWHVFPPQHDECIVNTAHGVISEGSTPDRSHIPSCCRDGSIRLVANGYSFVGLITSPLLSMHTLLYTHVTWYRYSQQSVISR